MNYRILLGFIVAALVAGSGCASFKNKSKVSVKVHEQMGPGLDQGLPLKFPELGISLTVNPVPSLTEKDVQSAELFTMASGTGVVLQFDPRGAMHLDELTTRMRGRYLVVFVDGKPVSVWLVDRRLTNGQLLVEGMMTDEEAIDLAARLKQSISKRGSW
jgi:preprotein translocase subunit SecD